MKKLKIAFLEPHLKIYGGTRRIIEFSNNLVDKGYKTTIYHSDGSPCTWLATKAQIKPEKEILKEESDILIFNFPTNYALVKKAKARIKIFYILELYQKEFLKNYFGLFKILFIQRNHVMLYLWLILRDKNLKFLVNSSWQKKWLKKNLNLNTEILFGGINTKLFHPEKSKKDKNKTVILCSGDPRPRKGTNTIIKAFKLIKKKTPEAALKAYSYKSKIPGAPQKPIPQEKMAKIYSSADVFVDGQMSSGWNNPVAEAMACKVPVVATDIGGVADFAINKKTALLVPAGNPQKMAQAILKLLKDEVLAKKLVQNAYIKVRRFSYKKMVDDFEKIVYKIKT